ncbi:Titin [Manis pentadactyla]|nr:Titin [Manis pentadactyla]
MENCYLVREAKTSQYCCGHSNKHGSASCCSMSFVFAQTRRACLGEHSTDSSKTFPPEHVKKRHNWLHPDIFHVEGHVKSMEPNA